jgi:hypothetical protein
VQLENHQQVQQGLTLARMCVVFSGFQKL